MANAQERASFNLMAHMVKEEPMEVTAPAEGGGGDITMPSASSFLSLMDSSKDEDMEMDRYILNDEDDGLWLDW